MNINHKYNIMNGKHDSGRNIFYFAYSEKIVRARRNVTIYDNLINYTK